MGLSRLFFFLSFSLMPLLFCNLPHICRPRHTPVISPVSAFPQSKANGIEGRPEEIRNSRPSSSPSPSLSSLEISGCLSLFLSLIVSHFRPTDRLSRRRRHFQLLLTLPFTNTKNRIAIIATEVQIKFQPVSIIHHQSACALAAVAPPTTEEMVSEY